MIVIYFLSPFYCTSCVIKLSTGGVDKMEPTFMMELKIQPFIKLLVLKIDLLMETEIVDEENFAFNDEFAIAQFKLKYINRDDCVIVKVEM